MRKQLVNTVSDLLDKDEKTVLLLGDIGVWGFYKASEKYPTRVYNIGILEQSMIGVAAGMSKCGLIPFVHTIAPFTTTRALEQLKLDFGYQHLNGNFISVGATNDYKGMGMSHYCPEDAMILNSIPEMQIVIPGTAKEFDTLLRQGYNNGNPTYYRLSEQQNKESFDVDFGKAKVIQKGKNATIIAIGNTLQNVIDINKNNDVTILYYTTIKPFDIETLRNNFNEKIIISEPYWEGVLNYYVSQIDKKCQIYNVGFNQQNKI